jgi:hypothetical protein
MFERDAEHGAAHPSEDHATDFPLDHELIALLDEVFVNAVPYARRLLQLLEERGWTGWTHLERISPQDLAGCEGGRRVTPRRRRRRR